MIVLLLDVGFLENFKFSFIVKRGVLQMHFELKGTILFCVKKLSEHALSLAHVFSDGVMGKLAGRK